MKINFETCLKHLELITLVFCTAPILLTFATITKVVYPTWQFWQDCLLIIFCAYLGYGQSFMKLKLKAKLKQTGVYRSMVIISYCIQYAVLLGVSALTHPTLSLVNLILVSLAIFLFNFFGRQYTATYDEILKWEMLIAAVFNYAIAFAFSKQSALPLLLIGVFTIFLLESNQHAIDEMLKRAKKNTPMIQGIKNYNLLWVVLLVTLVIATYPLRGMIGSFAIEVLREVLSLVWRGLCFIFNLFKRNYGPEEIQVVGQVAPEAALPEGKKSYDTLYAIMGTALVSWFIYANRYSIMYHLKDIPKRIKAFLSALAQYFFGAKNKAAGELAEYEDVIEGIETDSYRLLSKNKAYKNWKRQVKALLKQPASKTKDRQAYQLAVEGYKLKAVVLKAGDTPREISVQVENIAQLPSCTTESLIYEKVAYSDQKVDQDESQQLLLLLEKLVAAKKIVK